MVYILELGGIPDAWNLPGWAAPPVHSLIAVNAIVPPSAACGLIGVYILAKSWPHHVSDTWPRCIIGVAPLKSVPICTLLSVSAPIAARDISRSNGYQSDAVRQTMIDGFDIDGPSWSQHDPFTQEFTPEGQQYLLSGECQGERGIFLNMISRCTTIVKVIN